MTPDALAAAIRAADLDRCQALLAGASEKERRAAAPEVLRLFSDEEDPKGLLEAARAARFSPDLYRYRRMKAVELALHGTASLAELRRLGRSASFVDEQDGEALAARRPPWLDEWAVWALEQNPRAWPVVRRLARDGHCAWPETDAGVLGMIVAPDRDRPAREVLLGDPELLECGIWRLFEVEGSGEQSLAAHDKFTGGDRTWSATLAELAEKGHLDRARLLDASLAALARDFAQFRAGWFSRFHESLSPTLDERAARLDAYLGLLASRIPPTVSFALKALALLDRAGGVPPESLFAHVSPALAAREKATVLLALRLLGRAIAAEPQLAGAAARAAAEALLHESPEAQQAALDLILRQDGADPELRAVLEERLAGLAPSQRPRLAAWLALAGTGVEPEPGPREATVEDDLADRARALPPELAQLAGVPAALRSVSDLEASSGALILPPALDLRGFRVPRPAAPVSPVGALDDLLELLSAVLENVDPLRGCLLADDVERVLDGVARLCAERPADWARRTAPLRKRAAALLPRARCSVRDDLCRLALSWLTGEVPPPPEREPVDLTTFLSTRVLAVCLRAAREEAGETLAAPTHAGGWIEPMALVERVRRRPETAPRAAGAAVPAAFRRSLGPFAADPDRIDAVQALLRLAPWGRESALAAARDLGGEFGDALRHALGAEGVRVGPTASLWAAAARARDPWEDDPAVIGRHPDLGPGAGHAGRARLRAHARRSHGYDFIDHRLECEPPLPRRLSLDLPAVLHHAPTPAEYRYQLTAADRWWAATIWPAGRTAWFALGALEIAENLDWCEARWGNRVFLETLLEPDTDLDPSGRTLLGLGLAAKDPGESGVATDALIAAVADGRLDGDRLAEALRELLDLGSINASRWGRSLGTAARTSPLHGEVVRTAVEGALAGCAGQRPADLASLLTLLRELSVQAGQGVSDPLARAFLESQRGSGKAAGLARELLALPTNPHVPYCRAAAREALAGRLARAERWLAWGGG